MISINGQKILVESFPDTTPRILITDDITLFLPMCNPDNRFIIKWNYESSDEFFVIYCIARKLKDMGTAPGNIILDMPYIPNARMDRIKDKNHEVLTLKYFAELINMCEFAYVSVIDPHSSVSEALINRLSITMPFSAIQRVMHYISIQDEIPREDIMLFYPDEGAYKRYSNLYGMDKHDKLFGIKNRDWATGEIRGLEIPNSEIVKDRTVLIVDDICSRGGTFLHSAKKLRECGAKKIYLWVTHCENTILEGDLINSNLIDHIFTTESIFTKEHPLITKLYTSLGHIDFYDEDMLETVVKEVIGTSEKNDEEDKK